MVSKKSRTVVRENKHRKLRNRFSGTAERPRLAVFRMDIVMYGHTHKPHLEYCRDGLVVLNPGSLSYPRQEGRKPSYMLMELDRQGEAHFTICYLEDEARNQELEQKYENRRQKNAVYNVYAGADIVTAYGTKVYSKGDLVKENLTTGENGSVTLKNLHLGTYVVKETKAPDSFYNGSEEKSVTLTYAGQNKEVVFADVTFNNERQKADVSVVKQDKDTKKPLNGGIFALYASDDIRNADGTVVVKKGTLIEKATTGADGTAKFTADLPIGYSYSVKEDQAPEGYVRNTEDVYTFKFSYTNDKEATVLFAHTFSNDRVTAKINLFKVDKETGKAVPQGDATLKGAVYGLYAREDIVHPDGATGTIYKAGEQVASLTTDDKGQASVNGLYLGKYYGPPHGFRE